MPILESNIVFVAHQVMDDVPEGGGGATGKVIPDGQMNNVFEDISDLDRVYGRLNLRKLSVAVRTLSTDLFAGAKTVITALPADPAVGYTLFTTPDPYDTRTDAANRVEAYLFKGSMWPGALWENHIIGMRTINILQRVGTELPPVGKTLCLVQNEGGGNQMEQYVRVTDVTVTERTFTDSATGDFKRWQVTLDLSDGLRFNFTGHQASRTDNYNYNTGARLRDTSVADATRYFSSRPTASAAGIGDLSIRVAGVYTALVPSAQTETPLVNRPLADDRIPMIAAAAAPISYTAAGAAIGPGLRLVLRTGALPGGVSATVGSVAITDDGNGGVLRAGAVIGAIDYPSGEILFAANAPTASGTASIGYTPAASAPQQAHQLAITITPENRALNWVRTLDPLPADASLEFAYMVQGNWYALRSDAGGNIQGSDPSHGIGQVSAVTGVMQVTLANLPDVGSQILVTWASPVHYAIRAGATADAGTALELRYTLEHAPVVPGTHTATWPVGGAPRSTTDAGNGNLTGTGVAGTLDYATGEVVLRFTQPPDRAAQITNAYTWRDGDGLYSGTDADISGGQFTVPGTAPFRDGGTLRLLAGSGVVVSAYFAGGLLRARKGKATPAGATAEVKWADQVLGTFNATTGLVTITSSLATEANQWTGATWVPSSASESWPIVAVYDIHVERDTDAFDPQAITDEQVFPSEIGLTIDLTATVGDDVVAGSVLARITGLHYVARAGSLYVDPSVTTGAGLLAGSVDYSQGLLTLNYWADGAAVDLQVLACLTRYGQWSTTAVSFRTAAAPLKSESLQITATAMTGTALSAHATPDGTITGAGVTGSVNIEFGTAQVQFGVEVDPGTIRYNAVAYSYLPLDADILGIDPVRLPSDGRVPIFRRGDTILIMHAAQLTATPTPDGDEYVIELPRPRIAWVRITDADGQPVTEGYTLDRAAGRLRWDSIDGLATPLTVRHVVADLRMATDVQINGDITVARPLTHAFPAGETLVAACLIHGDRRARVSRTFDQATWNGTWSDSLVGNEATATLNLIDHPIVVTNEGCDTDRWVFRCTATATHQWELISEKRGLVWTGTYAPGGANVAPINPRTRGSDGQGGTPYMTIPGAANGGGWANGNIVRINTVGAIAHLWIARSIQQSDPPEDDGADGCEIHCLGNVDNPIQ